MFFYDVFIPYLYRQIIIVVLLLRSHSSIEIYIYNKSTQYE